MYDDKTLYSMTREELLKIPRTFWVQRKKMSMIQTNVSPLWHCENPDNLPCHGKRLIVKNRNGIALRAILYRPQESGKRPVYFHIHGGGFNKGYPETNDPELTMYCNQLGCCVIAVGYRLAPEYPYPAAVHDCYDVIKHFVHCAEQYGFDLERIGIGGESAGGNLANAVSMLVSEHKTFSIKVQMLVMPGCNNHDISGTGELLVHHITGIMSYVEDFSQTMEPYVSPFYASDEALRKMPSTIMITAENDDLHYYAEKYAVRLAENGVTITMKRFLGVGHVFALKDTEYYIETRAQEGLSFQVEQLRRYLFS